jgi:tRNA U34 5-carboxymethylaminomethyl modifying enzyme MnmG/GidA
MTAVLVVGGGVAGCELAWGLARRDVPTLLLTTTLDTLYALPADAWAADPPSGTLWSRIAAEADDGRGRQRAGPLRRAAKRELEREPRLRVVQSNATALWRSDDGAAVLGVRSWEGPAHRAETTVLAVGSFLGARLTLGAAVEQAGRLSEMAYDDLGDDLRSAGVVLRRHEIGVEGDGTTPAYRVAYDVVEASEWSPLRVDGRAVTGAGRSRRWPELWWLGAVVGDVGLEAAAVAGRDLAGHLAQRQAEAGSGDANAP